MTSCHSYRRCHFESFRPSRPHRSTRWTVPQERVRDQLSTWTPHMTCPGHGRPVPACAVFCVGSGSWCHIVFFCRALRKTSTTGFQGFVVTATDDLFVRCLPVVCHVAHSCAKLGESRGATAVFGFQPKVSSAIFMQHANSNQLDQKTCIYRRHVVSKTSRNKLENGQEL